jgi:predicted dehydrogenase
MNQGIHNVDLLYWFMGEVAEVSAVTSTLAHERIEVEDVGVAAITGDEGRKAVEIILAIYQSAWTGKRVALPLAKDPKRPG